MGEMKLDFKRMQRMQPIVTGTPQAVHGQSVQNTANRQEEGPSFSELLSQKLGEKGLTISKHAAQRAAQRGVDLDAHIDRLSQGVQIARQKGLDDALILVDSTAFLVSARNSTVITTVGGNDLKGNVFTNISGTVII